MAVPAPSIPERRLDATVPRRARNKGMRSRLLWDLVVVATPPVSGVQYAVSEKGDHDERNGRASGCPKRFGVIYHFTAARTDGDP